ncbi:hypothetical protein DEQ92_04750 [Haloferax sp. Atlit-6N]|uniref:hypothetical protein n=1 Tax=unclassified Haloferax TaxID=2625095 RepID=UPI000E24DB92|nr:MULTISPECIES: hypothetical protein [unclassified Haloferax]RDZ54775.1 hypothetical protein C5C07_04430 [Haloferax sp. Atlit-4N]REA05590.1 hypothetical protein DEQ92_04750 [Haloferax sp. Atlit-6N]
MRLSVLLAAALVVSTGCLGGASGTARLSVARVDDLPQGEGAVSYQNLAPAQQSAFREALGGETVTLREGTDRNEFRDPGYVRHDGEIYRTTIIVS